MDGVINHAGVKNFDFRLDAAHLECEAQLFQKSGRVHKYSAVLPVEGTCIKRGQLGQQGLEGTDALLITEVHGAGAGDVQADVAVPVGADAVDGFLIFAKIRGGGAVIVADVNMGNRRAGFTALVDVLGDLCGGNGQIRVVFTGRPGAGDSRGDYALVF